MLSVTLAPAPVEERHDLDVLRPSRDVARDLMAGLDGDVFPWPDSVQGRHKARIMLRRLHAAGDPPVVPWRAIHDRAPVEVEEGEEA